jgi:hypothetical protein
MNKMNKVVEYVKTHKKEIAITAFVGTIGAVCGIVGHKLYISKNYGELIKLVNERGECAKGRSLNERLCAILGNTTGSVYSCIPVNGDKTITEALGGELLEVFLEDGFDPNTKISGVMFGTIE